RFGTPAARSRRSGPTPCAPCRCSTACTVSCPRSSGWAAERWSRFPCGIAPGGSAGRSTACGTACSARSPTRWRCAGCSVGPCATGSGRSCSNARRLAETDRAGARRRAEPARAGGPGASPRRLPPLRRVAREPHRNAGGVRAVRGTAPRSHRPPAGDPRADPGIVDGAQPHRRRGRGLVCARAVGRARPDLAGMFFSRRPAGRSRRGLPLFEEDSYRRWARLVWGGTTRLYPFGAEWAGQRRALWVEITVDREFAAGETRPNEEVTLVDSAVGFNARAVVPPRRVTVRLSLVRGDTTSSPRALDLIPEAPGRRVSFT